MTKTSEKIDEWAVFTRAVQREGVGKTNAPVASGAINGFRKLDDEYQQLLKMAMTELNLSARAYDHIPKVARTMADADRAECIQPQRSSKDDNADGVSMDEY